uniref:Neur_chan_LBD domain-containing protein n=1 Tax=Panagrellus redivivus TaxID=6233 RepID=A0A7E4VWU7_PANRE
MSYLASFNLVNSLSQVCSDVKKFRSCIPNAHDQVYITDNHIVYHWAKTDTFLFRIWRYFHQFEITRKANDGDHTLKPAWTSVLLIDEIIDNDKKIYVDDTIILHCQIESYEKVLPYIFGPYTRLVLHGNITWNQVQRLIHPGVVQIRINARIHMQPAEYDDFVELATGHIRSNWHSFSFYNESYYDSALFTRLNTACRNLQNVVVKNDGYNSNTFHVMHERSSDNVMYNAGALFLGHCGFLMIMALVLKLISGNATAWYYNQPRPPESAFTIGCCSLLVLTFIPHYVLFWFGPHWIYPMDIISDRILENSTPEGWIAVAKRYVLNGIYWLVSLIKNWRELRNVNLDDYQLLIASAIIYIELYILLY